MVNTTPVCQSVRERGSVARRVLRGVDGVAPHQEAADDAEPWSNGPTEGHITRLKLLRRQMHGRGKLDFLRARLVAPA